MKAIKWLAFIAIAFVAISSGYGQQTAVQNSVTISNTTTNHQQSAIMSALQVETAQAISPMYVYPGWNLLGVQGQISVVPSAFKDVGVISVWKWDTVENNWYFAAPQLTDGGEAYAASTGYKFLTVINPGEGFWLSAPEGFTLNYQAEILPVTLEEVKAKVKIGWNLLGVGGDITSSEFDSEAVSVWKWNPVERRWYYYSPYFSDKGEAYATSAGYGFLTTIKAGEGFWVNSLVDNTVPHVYVYDVYASWGIEHYPHHVAVDGTVTKLLNRTQYTVGVYPLGGCWMMHPDFLLQTGGKILANCKDAVTLGRHVFYTDPSKEKALYDYDGIVPDGIVWISGINEYRPGLGPWFEVPDVGIFFTTYDVPNVLWFQDLVGTTIKAGGPTNSGIAYLVGYQHRLLTGTQQ